MNKSHKSTILKCPHCRRKIIGKNNNDTVLHNSIIIFTEDAALAYCPDCKGKVEVPIKLVA